MALELLSERRLDRRWLMAGSLFVLGFLGLFSGVGLSERPDASTAGIATKAYYALGLFVFGGLDIGMPTGGPLLGRISLWIAYFGAPVLTASALLTAILEAVAPHRWRLRRLRNHTVIAGAGSLTTSYLRLLRERDTKSSVVVLDASLSYLQEQELERRYHATVLRGNLSQGYLLRNLSLQHARRVLLFGEDDFESYETASKVLKRFPQLHNNVVLRSHNLRFMRSMAQTEVARNSQPFNVYQMAATALVQGHLLEHFDRTASLDTVVMAGFGRFGQTVLEQLQRYAGDKLQRIVIVDKDANRRVLVVEEQQQLRSDFERRVFQGDISHPEVWAKLADSIDLASLEPTVILGTGQVQHNLRTAVWLKQKYPNAKLYARTNEYSEFAEQISAEYDINSVSIADLMLANIPAQWID